jgi:type II secretory pathway component GspD/PulD (secretin)
MSSSRWTDLSAFVLLALACAARGALAEETVPAPWLAEPGHIQVGRDGVARLVYRPEFLDAPSLHAQVKQLAVAKLHLELVGPFVAVAPAPGQRGQPPPVPSRILLRGPEAAVLRGRTMLHGLDTSGGSVFVSVLVSEVDDEGRSATGGSLNLDKGVGPDPAQTFFRGFSTGFEPDDFLRSALTGASPFEGTTVRFAETEMPGGGVFDYTLRMLLKQGRAEFLAWPNLLCNEDHPAEMRSLRQVPRALLADGPAGRQGVTYQDMEVGLILSVRPIEIGRESAVLDLDVFLRRPKEVTDGSAPIGSLVLRSRRVRTRLTVRDREPLLVGGLYTHHGERGRRGLPRPRALSILDPMHSARLRTCARTELLFLVRARIIRPCRRPPEVYPDGHAAWWAGRTRDGAIVRSPWAPVPAGARQLDESPVPPVPPDRR